MPDIGQENGALMTSFPLMFVVGISMIKDAFEDNKRSKQDKAENEAMCMAVPRGGTSFSEIKSLEIQVGCIVKVMEN